MDLQFSNSTDIEVDNDKQVTPIYFRRKVNVNMSFGVKNRKSREYCFDIHKHLLLHISCCNSFMATLAQVINLHTYFLFSISPNNYSLKTITSTHLSVLKMCAQFSSTLLHKQMKKYLLEVLWLWKKDGA